MLSKSCILIYIIQIPNPLFLLISTLGVRLVSSNPKPRGTRRSRHWIEVRRNRMKKNPVSVPDDLFFGILSYLPVKSLLRFRFVCKMWSSMISDPSFTEAHRCHSNSSSALLISFPKFCSAGSNMQCTLVSVRMEKLDIRLSPNSLAG